MQPFATGGSLPTGHVPFPPGTLRTPAGSREGVLPLCRELDIPAVSWTLAPLRKYPPRGFHHPGAVRTPAIRPQHDLGRSTRRLWSSLFRFAHGSRVARFSSHSRPTRVGFCRQTRLGLPPLAVHVSEPGTQGKERPALRRMSKSAFAASHSVPGTRRIRRRAPSAPRPRFPRLSRFRGAWGYRFFGLAPCLGRANRSAEEAASSPGLRGRRLNADGERPGRLLAIRSSSSAIRARPCAQRNTHIVVLRVLQTWRQASCRVLCSLTSVVGRSAEWAA